MSMLGPNTCSDSSLCQLHISIYKLSPSALRYHVGVVSSVCFYFAILLHCLLLNRGESALIRDQPSLKHSFITVESREELRNYVHPLQGWTFAFSLLVNLWKTRSVVDAHKNASIWKHKKVSGGGITSFVSTCTVICHTDNGAGTWQFFETTEFCCSQCLKESLPSLWYNGTKMAVVGLWPSKHKKK